MSGQHSSEVCSTSDAWELAYSHYIYPSVCAATIFVVPHLRGTWQTIATLARKSSLPEDAIAALIPALLLIGGTEVQNGLLRRRVDALPDNVLLTCVERHARLDPHVRRELNAFRRVTVGASQNFWLRTIRSTERRILVLRSIDALTSVTTPALIRELDRHRARHLCDVGAGYGTVTRQALAELPLLTVTAIDRSEVLEDWWRVHPQTPRENTPALKRMAVDLLSNRWPTGADVYLLSHLLQDFGAHSRRRLLARAKACIHGTQELWLHGIFPSSSSVSALAAAFSFYLYARLGGGLPSVEQSVREAEEAGFHHVRSIATSRYHTLLVFRKRSSE